MNLVLGSKPSSVKNLFCYLSFDPASLERELRWAAESFILHSSELNRAWRHARAIEDALLVEDFQGALNLLSEVDERCGHSMWSIELRIALLQHHEGLASQKAYANEIIEDSSRVVAVVTHYTSQRNEEQMPLRRFEATLDRMLAPSPDSTGTYLRYRLLHEVDVAEGPYRTILNAESQSSILDYYETFVSLAQRAALQTCPPGFRELLTETLQSVEGALDDPRLRRALFAFGAGEAWLDGAWDAGSSSMNDYLDDVEAWRLVSEGLAFEDLAAESTGALNAVATQTVSALQNLADFPNLGDEVASAQRFAANLRGLQIGRALRCALDEQYASTTAQLRECRANAAMHSRHIWPTHLLGCLTSAQLAALVGSLRASPEFPLLIWAALRELGTPCPSDASQGLEALQAEVQRVINGSYYAPKTTLAADPPTGSERARSRVALRFRTSALLERGEIDEMIRLVASHAAVGRNIGILPIVEAFAQIDRPTTSRLAGELALPIVFDLYVRYCSADLEEDRAFACEDFLAKRGVERPHQLANLEGTEDRGLLIYFLRFLAIPDIMESFTVFESTSDLEDERIRVLSALIVIDPANADAYEAEAKDITRTQAIHRGMRQVEQSKIYVDTVRIRKILERELHDDFARYMSLPHLPPGESRENLLDALRIVFSGPTPSLLPEIPKDESSVLLVQMMNNAFGELTSNKEHGLDCYLSMRIRHGALSGQLRTPMEKQGLITRVSADGHTYEPNTAWLDRPLSGGRARSSDGEGQLRERMNEVSAAYDREVDRVAKEYVQIRSTEKPSGWFDISVRQFHVLDLLASISQDTTFEEFLDLLISSFYSELAGALARVRSAIEDTVKPSLLEPISAFEMDVASFADVSIQPSLKGALATARVEVQQSLDVVKDWFRLPQIEESDHSFDMEDLVRIGLQCVKVLHVDYHPDLRTEIGEVTQILDPLVVFTDIFVILFENARVHSGSNGPIIRVSINQVDETCILHVENSVIGSIDEDRVRKIERIREQIESGSYIDSVAKEGGSGLIKLQRIVSLLDENGTIQFGHEADKFWTTVPIRLRFL